MESMQEYKEDQTRGSVVKEAVFVGWRALRSTVVIGAVAVTVSAARGGDFRWSVITWLAWSYRTLLTMVFLGLLVWDWRFRRARRRAENRLGDHS